MFGRKKKKKPVVDNVTNMAGPETNRRDITYQVPLPKAGVPVYFGGKEYMEKYKAGFDEQATAHAREIANSNFTPSNVGQGRAIDWRGGIPDRNLQGWDGKIKNVTTSAPTSNPNPGGGIMENNKPGPS